MKKIIIIFAIMAVLFSAFSSEKDVVSTINFGKLLNIRHFDSKTDETVSSTTAPDSVFKAIKILTITHMVLGGISYIGFVANDGIGFSMLYNAYTNPNYYTDPVRLGLQVAHKAIMVNSYISYGFNAILGFVNLGLKLYYGLPINTFHVIAGFITTTLYIFEIVSMAITKWAYDTAQPFRKELSLAHGMLSGTMTLSMTLTIIAVPVGYKHKKVWKFKIKGSK